jgi:putative YhdH/YhfP family quinone oxidoreductase
MAARNGKKNSPWSANAFLNAFNMDYQALVVFEENKKFIRRIISRKLEDLPAGDVLIRVHYSSLNYKDALSATGNKGITRNFPHTPGIDAAGVVVTSNNELFRKGDEVLVTGYDLGMNTAGGYSEFIRVPAGWIIKKPAGLSLKECMIIGTAGFTAATALFKLQCMGQDPEMGPLVVTGSTGGVGSLAVALLAKAGFDVIAVTGKKDVSVYLSMLGAKEIQPRDFVNDVSGKALIKPKWAGGIDTAGGLILETLLKGCMVEGNIVSTGLVASPQLSLTVFPFILNGVSLLGVGSAGMPMSIREIIWQKLTGEWNIQPKLSSIAKEVSLQSLNDRYIDEILAGQITGRVVIKI